MHAHTEYTKYLLGASVISVILFDIIVFSKYLSKNTVLTMKALEDGLKDCIKNNSEKSYEAEVEVVRYFPGWRDTLEEVIGKMTGHSVPHIFK